MADSALPLDRIHIRDLRLRCILGLNDWEREKEQDITLNITLHADLSAAGASDNIDDTVDYKGTKQRIVQHVEASRCCLVERLATEVADLCLEDARIRHVDVCIDKPGALRFARSVAVELSRGR